MNHLYVLSLSLMKDSYKILGVDPGTNQLGYALIEVRGKELKLITLGILRLKSYEDHQTKLKEIFLQLQEIIETYLPKQMAVEAPFYGKNVQSMLKLGRAQGVAMAAAMTMGLEISEYAPKKIKQSVTGNGNASKEQVAAMLNSILKVKIDTPNLDATDALGVAICHYYQTGGVMGGQKKYIGWDSFLKDNPGKKFKL
ncbi:MAG: crossover junction endodeoxyribonuclease RuvC [Saprospiraceae bacterium]|jgi:crossover junction endodeoxyribonuclease RuvC|nr:crossover junction endodeoxyribonuclease RuvC [Saprospiraceae bacterium]